LVAYYVKIGLTTNMDSHAITLDYKRVHQLGSCITLVLITVH